MIAVQHTKARLKSIDHGGCVGAGSRQNFGSVTAQGKKKLWG
jgi:hypothetical protein